MLAKIDETHRAEASRSALVGQVVACVVALGIMGLGGWSLLGQQAPYHPDNYGNEVTRGMSSMMGPSEGN